jgi:hypothetical protein
MLNAVFWVVTLCSLVGDYQRFGKNITPILRVEMELIGTSETVITYKTLCRHKTEDHESTQPDTIIMKMPSFRYSVARQ